MYSAHFILLSGLLSGLTIRGSVGVNSAQDTSPEPVNTTAESVDAAIAASISASTINLSFKLRTKYNKTLENTTSSEFLTLANKVVSELEIIYSEKFGDIFSGTVVNSFSSESGLVVVDADLVFYDDVSPSAVENTIASATNFSLPLITSSVVTRIKSTQIDLNLSTVAPPNQANLTTFAHSTVRLSSSVELGRDAITFYIEEFFRKINADALGPLKITVKRVARVDRCSGTQCEDVDDVEPPTSTLGLLPAGADPVSDEMDVN